jgi:hypothetical protein
MISTDGFNSSWVNGSPMLELDARETGPCNESLPLIFVWQDVFDR